MCFCIVGDFVLYYMIDWQLVVRLCPGTSVTQRDPVRKMPSMSSLRSWGQSLTDRFQWKSGTTGFIASQFIIKYGKTVERLNDCDLSCQVIWDMLYIPIFFPFLPAILSWSCRATRYQTLENSSATSSKTRTWSAEKSSCCYRWYGENGAYMCNLKWLKPALWKCFQYMLYSVWWQNVSLHQNDALFYYKD